MSEVSHDSPDAPQPPPEAAEAAYPTLDELGHLLPQYEMHEVIGVGGMGAVYKARQAALDRWVAIKLLPASASQNEEDAHRFIKEARAMARLVHPHIVAVFDFGQTHAGHLYLVMEYVEGCDLHRRTRAKEITPQRAREVIAQLCDALQFAHDHGVAHRDIKPANILITDQWKVKVADFGLARELAAQPNSDEPEYGTPDYTAPERLIVGAVVDHRADIYALGVVIHEMLTGKTPSAAGAEAGKDLPPGFAGVISKCLMHDPARRFQRAADVKIALLTATAENKNATTATHSTSRPPKNLSGGPAEAAPPRRPALTSLAPILWGLASVAVLMLLGWLVLRNKTRQWDAPVANAPANTTAGSGSLSVFAPTTPEPPAAEPPAVPTPPPPVPAVKPEPPPPMAIATAPPPKPKPSEDPLITAPHTPLDQPFLAPDGPAGEIARFKGHTAAVYSVAILPDQRRIVSVSYDDTLRVWDALAQQELLRVDVGIGDLSRVVVSSDGKRALVASTVTEKLAVVDLETGKVRATTGLPHDRLTRAIFLPGGEEILIGGTSAEQNLFRWKPQPDSPLQPVTSWAHWAYDMVPIENGREILIAGAKPSDNNPKAFVTLAGRLNLADEQTVQIPQRLMFVTSISVGRDAAQAAVIAASSLSVVTWPGFEPVHEIKLVPKEARPRSIALVDSNRLVAGSWTDSTLRVLEAATGAEVYRTSQPERFTDCAFSRDERWAVLGSRELKAGTATEGDFDLLLWRMPKWNDLISDQTLAKQAETQLADLATHDPELAAVRAELEKVLKDSETADNGTELQTLNSQYIAALRREAQSKAPTEQRVLLGEVDLIVLGGGLPAEGMDLAAPEILRKLRSIYRQQLAALAEKQQKARDQISQTVEARLHPLRDQRQSAADRLGAARVDLVLKSLLPADAASTAPGAPNQGAPAQAAGTPSQRPSRAGTVFAVGRTGLNSNPPFSQPKVGRIPPDLGGVVAITGGADHIFALLPNGRVRGWGAWGNEDTKVPDSAANVVRLDSTSSAALALRSDGQVVVWGPGKAETVWQAPAGKAPMEICAGSNATGWVLCTDGTVLRTDESLPAPPDDLPPVACLFYVPDAGVCAVRRDGIPVYWGSNTDSVTPVVLPGLRDVACVSFGQRYAVAMQRDGTVIGWGQLAPDQRFRIRRFTGSVAILHDYADRVFPVHRGDHAWELIPNPNIPGYLAEDRLAVLEGRLRGSVDAVFTQYYVIGLRLQ
ncbi:MAG TPA: protein kinase [Prosthecobacter sp.]|nr:protein kinase [Prosthecobacter sp.]